MNQSKKRYLKKISFQKVIESPQEKHFYEEVFFEIINFLQKNGKSTFQEIIKFVQGGDRRTLRLLDEMVKNKFISFSSGNFFIKPRKTSVITPSLKMKDIACPKCSNGVINNNDPYFQKLKNIMQKIYIKRPKPTFIFDQRPVTFETTIKRAFYMVWRGDIQDKKIAIIGDDDLTSLALGFLKMAKSITVFEIDKRFVRFLRKMSKLYNLKLHIIERDVLQGIPKRYLENFDVFMADPTPTAVPFTVFVNTGIKLLKKEKEMVGYLSFYSSSMPRSIELQRILTEMNLMITDCIPFFTEYEAIKRTYSPRDLKLIKQYADQFPKVGFFESLVRVETTLKTKTKRVSAKLEDMIGRATKRVLKNNDKDPALNLDILNRDYLRGQAKDLQNKVQKKIELKQD